jgi:hypothetical protein
MRFQDAIDLITTDGWDPNASTAKADTYEIGVTDDLARQLAHRRMDLSAINADRLDDLPDNKPIAADLLAEITADRHAAATLDRLVGTYSAARARRRHYPCSRPGRGTTPRPGPSSCAAIIAVVA